MKTRERVLSILALVTLFSVVGTRAQNPLATPFYFTSPAVAYSTSTCPPPPTGYIAACATAAGIYFIPASGAPVLLGAATSSNGVLTVNGTAPGPTGNVTVACPATTTSAGGALSAPPLSISGGNLVVGAPAATARTFATTTTCTGAGS